MWSAVPAKAAGTGPAWEECTRKKHKRQWHTLHTRANGRVVRSRRAQNQHEMLLHGGRCRLSCTWGPWSGRLLSQVLGLRRAIRAGCC